MRNFDKTFETLLERYEYPSDILEKYKDDPAVFVTFTAPVTPRGNDRYATRPVSRKATKVGINPKSSYDTPIGVYTYPVKAYYDTLKGYDSIPFQSDKPYVYFVKAKNPDRLAYESTYTQEDLDRDMEELSEIFPQFDVYDIPSTISSNYKKTPLQTFWGVTRNIAKKIYYRTDKSKVPVIWTQIMRRFYDGIVDDTGNKTIHGNEPVQAVLWTKAQFDIVDFVDRTRTKGNSASKGTWKDTTSKFKPNPNIKGRVERTDYKIIQYDDQGRKVTVLDKMNPDYSVRYTYDDVNNAVKEEDADGNYTIKSTKPGEDDRPIVRKSNGGVFHYKYWDNGELRSRKSDDGEYIQINDKLGRKTYDKSGTDFTKIKYHGDTHYTKYINSSGSKTWYNPQGHPTRQEDSNGNWSVTEYWPGGRTAKSITTSAGNESTYNKFGRPLYVYNALDGTTTRYIYFNKDNSEDHSNYDSDEGDDVKQIYVDGKLAYSAIRPYLVEYDNRDGEEIEITYWSTDIHNPRIKEKSIDGVVVLKNNENGKPIYKDEYGEKKHFEYYDDGKTAKKVRSEGNHTSYFDEKGNLRKKITNTGNIYMYNDMGDITYRGEESGNIEKDKYGDTLDGDGKNMSKIYWSNGNLKKIINYTDGKIKHYDTWGDYEGTTEMEDLDVDDDSNVSSVKNEHFLKEFQYLLEMYESGSIDLDTAYDIFRTEYLKSTGQAWSREKFMSRAQNWNFYGDMNGYVAVRPQASGFVKLVGAAGSDKSKYKGFKELAAKKLPVWGMVDDKLFGLLGKLGYRGPNKLELWAFKKFMTPEKMASVLGGATINSIEGNKVTLTYPDLGTITKYYIASPEYWKKIRGNII